MLNAEFSPDGSRLATASNDGSAKIWDLNSAQELLTLSGHQGGITDVAFSPDGTLLYTASLDGTVRTHFLEIVDLVELARSRLTRGFTEQECRKYLQAEQCPE